MLKPNAQLIIKIVNIDVTVMCLDCLTFQTINDGLGLSEERR